MNPASSVPSIRSALLLLAVTLLLAAHPLAHAAEAPPVAADEKVEKRLVSLASELRCLVCQNESLAASNAELAQDLRREIRTLILDNKSDGEIMEFMVSRYGDFVRYRPPLRAATLALWFGPLALLLAGLGGLFAYLRRRNHTLQDEPLSPEQQKEAERLLNPNGPTP